MPPSDRASRADNLIRVVKHISGDFLASAPQAGTDAYGSTEALALDALRSALETRRDKINAALAILTTPEATPRE